VNSNSDSNSSSSNREQRVNKRLPTMFEKIRSKIVVKIGILIVIETLFIISSFGILAYFQSEGSSLGNSINIAGKNRYLTGNVLFEAEKYLESSSSTDLSKLRAAIDNLESNISVLKQGGKISGIELEPLSSEFSSLWDIINKQWQSYKMFINEKIINPNQRLSAVEVGQQQQQPVKTELESIALGLIDSSDTLVTRLGQYVDRNSYNLMLLEVILAVTNIGVLNLILYLVIKTLRPIFALTRATSEVKKGNYDVVVSPKGNDELATLSESFNSMISSIRNYVKLQTELKNEVQKANDELKNKNRLMDEFINIAAHELRTPIQPILGLSELVRTKVDGEQRECMDVIMRNARRLQTLTQNILDLTKIESRALNLNKESFDLNDMISKIVEENARQIDKTQNGHGLKLIHDCSKESIIIEADRERLNQVISNLLANAIKFTKEGTISISEQENIVSKDSKIREVIVIVKDSGSGIDTKIAPKLFSKFATTSGKGTGLGLFISKNIIEAHGGKIWATNNPERERGATFTFSLPLVTKIQHQIFEMMKTGS
jgi:signal transduction histidine kinase